MRELQSLFLVIIAATLAIFFYRRMRNKHLVKEKLYQDFAKKYDLKHSTESDLISILNKVSGEIKGHSIVIEEIIKDRSGKVFTRLSIENHSNSFQFRIGRKRRLEKFVPSPHVTEINFDDLGSHDFVFHSEDESSFRRLMNYKVLEELIELEPIFTGDLVNTDGKLNYEYLGGLYTTGDIERLETKIDFMAHFL